MAYTRIVISNVGKETPSTVRTKMWGAHARHSTKGKGKHVTHSDARHKERNKDTKDKDKGGPDTHLEQNLVD